MGHCGLEYGGKVRPGRPTAIQPRIFRRRIIARLKQEHFIVQILTVRDQTRSTVEDNNPGALQAIRVRGRTGLLIEHQIIMAQRVANVLRISFEQ